jgi:hypothetical protein
MRRGLIVASVASSNPEPGEPADPEVLDEDVGVREESAEDLATGRLQVDPDRPLVPVDRQVVRRDTRIVGSQPAGAHQGGPQARVPSPSGGSTLITAAPRSARSIVQYGPASTVEQSTTTMPASGPLGSG